MITRELKDYTFEFDEEEKTLKICERLTPDTIILDKVRMFSLFRFLIRISQKMTTKRRVVKQNE